MSEAKQTNKEQDSRIAALEDAIRIAVRDFGAVDWDWDGDCGSGEIMGILEDALEDETE